MGPGLIVLAALASPLARQSSDTTTYSSPAARDLIARAAARHRAQDSSVADYRARLRYRLSLSVGRRRWGNAPPFAAEEQDATVAWKLPNDLRVDIQGQRSRSREADVRMFSAFDSPWFVPRGLSDSVRVFGTDIPGRAALHPLASDGPSWYRYTLADTVTLGTPDGRRVRLAMVDVVPRRSGPALVAGRIWLDLATAEVVRFAFRYIGTELWVTPEAPTAKDSAAARRGNRLANRILSIDADLEYALQEGKYWMPYRQVLSGQVQIPLVGDIFIPFEAVTTFSDYEINTGQPVVFQLARPDSVRRRTRAERAAHRDSVRAERRGDIRGDSATARTVAGLLPAGGRYEIRRAPRDSLLGYSGWSDSLELRMTEADERRLRDTRRELADLVEGLPRQISGRQVTGFSYERLADAFRFNRVQGTSIGLGYQLDIHGMKYTSLYGTARYGLSDTRLTARAALVRDAPAGKTSVAVYHDLSEGDPFGRGLSAANSIRALVSARDEGEYFRATGASLSWETSLGTAAELLLNGRFERQRSAEGKATAWLNDVFGGDGLLGFNPPIDEGDYGVLAMRADGQLGRARWQLGMDGAMSTDGEHSAARLHGQWRQPVGGRTGLTLRARTGIAALSSASQFAFRAGGQASVRGFDYGIQRGDAFWAVQADVTPWRRAIRPVFFVDAGQAAMREDLLSRPVLVGGGAGLSLLNGLVRFDLSHPISPRPSGTGLRLDLVFGAPR